MHQPPHDHNKAALLGTIGFGLLLFIAMSAILFGLFGCHRTYLLQKPAAPVVVDTIPQVGFGDSTNQSSVDSALLAIDAPTLPSSPPIDTFTYRLQFQMANFGVRNYDQIDADIDRSLAKTNDYFRGYIKFERDPFIYDYEMESASIYTLFDDFAERQTIYNRWVNQRAATEEERVITVFLLPTYAKGNSMLLGFCPVLLNAFDHYERYYTIPQLTDNVPENDEANFEHLFISYEGASRGSTLGHELGHWLGLAHTWELDDFALGKQGLTLAATRDRNLMNYVEHPTELTDGQLQTAWQFAGAYRSYLLR